MFVQLIKLIVLFVVIFDPLASFAVFVVATQHMLPKERRRTAMLSVLVAGSISLGFLLLGKYLLIAFSTTLDEFRIAGGIILGILGVKMALGHSLADLDSVRHSSGRAIAAIIGTPLLTGPAAITAIMISTSDFGIATTGLAVFIVLLGTAVLFYYAEALSHKFGKTFIQVLSTILGLITTAWGVKFIREGLGI